MPRQPLYNEGSPVRTQPGQERMVTGAGAGRGVTLDESAFIGSVKAPLLDDSGAVAEGRGLAALGQGMAKAGDAVLALAREAAEARNHNAVQEIHNKQQLASAQMWSRIEKEPDTAKHQAIADEFIQSAPGSWTDPNAPPVVRDEAEALTKRWTADVNSKVLIYSSRKELEKEERSLTAIQRNAEVMKNVGVLDQTVDRRVNRGFLTPEEGTLEKNLGREKIQEQVTRDEAKARSENIKFHKNNIATLSGKDTPEKIKDYVRSDENLDPSDVKLLENYVDELDRDGTSAALNSVTESIYAGDIDNEGQLDWEILGNKYVTPTLRKEMSKTLKDFDKLKAKEEREGPNGVQNFMRLYRAAKEWNPVRNTPEAASKYLDMMTKVRASVPDDLQQDVIEILGTKFGDSKVKKSARPEVTKLITDNISVTMGKVLQPYKDSVARLANTAGSETRDELDAALTELYKKSLEVNVREAKIQTEMNDWIATHPNPSVEDANKKLMTLLDPKTLIQDLNEVMNAIKGVTGARSVKPTALPAPVTPAEPAEKRQSSGGNENIANELPGNTESGGGTYIQEGNADATLRGPSTDLLIEPPDNALSPGEGDELPQITDEEHRNIQKEMDAGKKKKKQ